MSATTDIQSEVTRALAVRDQVPKGGLFAGQEWRIPPNPFPLGERMVRELEGLGRVLLQFYRAANLLYRKSAEGAQPSWVARWLDLGKPPDLIELHRSQSFKLDVPRVIRPDLLITEDGLRVTELDSVPGGIGVTAWLNEVYSNLGFPVIGGPDGMLSGFASIFGTAPKVHIIVSEEAATYRPEMLWVAEKLGSARFQVQNSDFTDFKAGDAVYRFFELFDAANVANSSRIFRLANEKQIRLTPPPKAFLEEKMLFALLCNRNLREFWRRELGESFFQRLLRLVPYTWVVNPEPLPPHGAIPGLDLTDWQQLKELSQKQRDLILKVSGFSPHAWGARGVYLGSDLSSADWGVAVDEAIRKFHTSPRVVQRFFKPGLVRTSWLDVPNTSIVLMEGRARLCPYYFVQGEGDDARARLGGVLATICPADKKIIHGMRDAVFAPCSI